MAAEYCSFRALGRKRVRRGSVAPLSSDKVLVQTRGVAWFGEEFVRFRTAFDGSWLSSVRPMSDSVPGQIIEIHIDQQGLSRFVQ